MQSEKETNYKLIKQKHIVPAIIRLLLTYVLLIVLAIFISDMAISYLCDANLESEYKAVKYMAGLYENATDKDSIQSLLEQEDRDFLVVDPNGNVLKSKGENTCSFNGGMVTASGIDRDFNVYYNSTDNVWSVSSNKDFDISFNKAYNQVKEYELISQIFSSSDGKNVAVPLYYWISIDFLDGSGSFVGKAAYEVKTRDIGLILLFIFILSSLAVALFIALLVRIVKRFSRQRKLLSVFFTDVVTKGHNWMWFTIKGEQQLRKKKNDKLNFALLNIVFVKYNTYCVCHSVEEGERALQAVNRTISKSINKYEACAHHGTSSFAVLMQYSDEEVLKKKVKFILRHLESVESVHKFAFHVGIALMPAILESDGKYARRTKIDIEKIYHNACAASATLESSDDSAIAFFDDKLVEEQKWIDHVVEKQQQAIDNEEFLIYYQPKYDPSTDTLRGAEALIRWQSPDYGFVTPGRIIPIFEKNGFITEIDHYMLTHVARDQRRWLDKGFKCVPVSVNVSRAHFIESDLAEQIRDAVDKEGAPHELIEIELTESAFFDDKKALITTIEKLKSYGFSVSMDDFGAGYSSLNSLKDMPLDVLKLDADFFRGESEGNRGEIVVSEAIRLAKALNMRTVAEGVEVKEQVEFLAKQGCDMIQGYYYAKPMIGTDYEQRMGMMGEQPEEDNLKLKQITIQDMNQDSFMPEAEKSVETPVESSGLDVADNLSGESSSIVAESLAIEGVSATVGSLITEGDSAVADKTAIEDVSDVAGSLIAEGVSAAADNLMTESGLKVCSSTPKSDGFYMPGEFEPHRGTIMIWPERPGSWPYGAKAARKAFAQIIETIAENEEVFVAVSEKGYESAEETLKEIKNVKLFVADTDDAWARDVAPTFVKNGEGNVRAVNWSFNAWGGTYNGLYASWEKDDAFAKFFAEKEEYDLYDAAPFVLEGGSIHSDGEGTVIVTGECLLSPGRNPQLSKEEIEQKLKEYLGAEKVIWLPNGIYNDETDGHVDNICAFIRPSEVVLAWTDDENDPQYALSSENLKILESETDAKGRSFTVHKLPIPKTPVVVGEEDIKGYEFEAGEDEREVGERLAASYVNFYFSNGAVIVPAFGGENEESDSEAAKILAELCPDRKVVQIPTRDILLGGGNIHCITQQIPQ